MPLIMHVVFRFAVGGLENGIVNLINRLPRGEFRHAVVALTSCEPEFCRRIERDDVEFISLHKPPGHGWRLFPKMRSIFREYRPAIVHTRNLAALEMQLPACMARVPIRIHGEHGWDVSDPDGTNRRYRLVRRAYGPFVSRYIAVSADLEAYLRNAIGVDAQRVSCILNGVDEKRFFPREPADGAETFAGGERALVGRPHGHVIIGAVGRLQEIKGHAVLIDAVHRLIEEEPERRETLRLRLIGDGALRRMLEEKAASLGLGDVVEFLGERSDIPALMRQLDVFVLPSLAEGISNTILEAMASGLPVVATEVGGNPQLVTQAETGLLVPPADSAGMAEAIALYLDSPELRAHHGACAREEVETRFALSGMIERYRVLYHDALARQGRTAPAQAG